MPDRLISPLTRTVVRMTLLTLKVVGVLEPTGLRAGSEGAAMMQLDPDQGVYFPLTLARSSFGDSITKFSAGSRERKNIELSEVWLQAHDTRNVERLASVAENAVRTAHGPKDDVQVKAPIQILRAAERTQRTFNFIMVGIAAFALIYWYETVRFAVAGFNPGLLTVHVQCMVHLILFWLMLVATFIDFDEQTIPDAITLPVTLLGLFLAALLPQSRAVVALPATIGYSYDFLHLASAAAVPGSRGWKDWLDGPAGLAIGILGFVAWCAAVK